MKPKAGNEVILFHLISSNMAVGCLFQFFEVSLFFEFVSPVLVIRTCCMLFEIDLKDYFMR